MKSLIAAFCLTLSFSSFAFNVGKVDIQQVLLTIKEGKSVRDKLKKNLKRRKKFLIKNKVK